MTIIKKYLWISKYFVLIVCQTHFFVFFPFVFLFLTSTYCEHLLFKCWFGHFYPKKKLWSVCIFCIFYSNIYLTCFFFQFLALVVNLLRIKIFFEPSKLFFSLCCVPFLQQTNEKRRNKTKICRSTTHSIISSPNKHMENFIGPSSSTGEIYQRTK